MTTTEPTLSANVANVRERIERACERAGRSADEVTLIGVTKMHDASTVQRAWEAGIRDFGENRAQEGCGKVASLAERGLRPRWHFIGHLQTNKVRDVVASFDVLHSLDSTRLLGALEREVTRQRREPLDVFIEVNVAGEESKSGVRESQLGGLLELARSSPAVRVCGFMTVAPLTRDTGLVRSVFRRLRELAHSMELAELSMGMTEDFEIAIEEGATHIRVGRALFGERKA